MEPLPDQLRSKFFEFLHGEEPIKKFEQWVYATNALEEVLTDNDYLKLISLDFLNRNSKYEIEKLLQRYIDVGEYEMWKLRKLLTTVLAKEKNLPQVLSKFYNLYCDGYYFLEHLGLGCGLAVRVPPSEYSSDSWDELSDEEKSKLLNSLLPEAISEA